jgi:hypothetical protein
MATAPRWWAEGLLLENCNCRLLCRCHIHYSQPADHERCLGFLAFQIERGRYGETTLDGCRAVHISDTPQVMLEAGWRVALLMDEQTTPAQRDALEAILGGRAGGGWAALAALVERREPTRYLPIGMTPEAGGWRLRAGELLDCVLEPTRGRDKSASIRLENIFNQVHGSSQALAWGSARYGAPYEHFGTERSHSLWSAFSWKGP